MTNRVIAPIHDCWDEKILSRTMVSNVSAAVPVPPQRNAQERSIRAAFIIHGNAVPSDGPDMWRTVVKEAATNWSSHKDARQGLRSHIILCFRLAPSS